MNLSALNARVESLGAGETLRLEGIDDHVYHNSLGYGSTAIKKMLECPAVFHHYINEPHKLSTEAQQIGTAIHCEILTPFDFWDQHVYQPADLARRGKVWTEFKDAHAGKTILRPNAEEVIMGCSGAVLESFGHLFSGGSAEVSYWHRDEETGILLKGRMDYELTVEFSLIDVQRGRATRSGSASDGCTEAGSRPAEH